MSTPNTLAFLCVFVLWSKIISAERIIGIKNILRPALGYDLSVCQNSSKSGQPFRRNTHKQHSLSQLLEKFTQLFKKIFAL